MERTSRGQDQAGSGGAATLERPDQDQAGQTLCPDFAMTQGLGSKKQGEEDIITGTILLIEEEETLRAGIQLALERAGFAVIPTQGSDQAMRSIEENSVDLVLADVRLGGLDGPALFRKLKIDPCTTDIPVILMGEDWVDDANLARECKVGADDFLLKPFSSQVLVTAVRSVLSCYRAVKRSEERITVGDLAVEPARRTVTVGGTAVPLTHKEFDLLLGFLRGRGRVFSHGSLLKTVWGYDPSRYCEAHTIKVHVSSLRTKLGPLGSQIVRVPGVGYKWAI